MPPKEPMRPKATERIVARSTEELKSQLSTALAKHPHFQGNVSEWVNACAQSWVLQTRRGETPDFPIEFVTKTTP